MMAETVEWSVGDIYEVVGRQWEQATLGNNFEGDRF
jgi:hypothetical protein